MKAFLAYSDELPPSANKLKAIVNGHMVLTAKARHYKIKLFEDLKRVPSPKFDRNEALAITITFEMPDLETQGFSTGKAKYRFKKRDVSNMVPLLENVVCTYLEIDDSQFLDENIRKRKGEQAGIWIEVTTLDWMS